MTYKEFVSWLEDTIDSTHRIHDLGETVVVASDNNSLTGDRTKYFITKDGDVFLDLDWYDSNMGSFHTRIAKGKSFEQIKHLINFIK